MLVCWGASWPAAIRKSLKSKSTRGKSLLFMILIFSGYIFAIINKMLRGFDYVFWFYILVMGMVLVDICLYFRNRRIEKREAEEASETDWD